jgi:hypothetical protein
MRRRQSFVSDEVSIDNTEQTFKAIAALIVLVLLVALAVGFPMWNTARSMSSSKAATARAEKAAAGAVLIPSNIKRAQDPNMASWRAMLNPRAVDLPQATPGAHSGDAAMRSDTMKEIQKKTRDDGAVRRVAINGAPVAPELVEETIFDNRNFATRYDFEFPQFAKKQSTDSTRERPKMMFGPLTAPLANGYGMDVGGKIIA